MNNQNDAMEKLEYEVGETIQVGLITLTCEEQIKNKICEGCYGKLFFHDACEEVFGNCSSHYRIDRKDVIFKLKKCEK